MSKIMKIIKHVTKPKKQNKTEQGRLSWVHPMKPHNPKKGEQP